MARVMLFRGGAGQRYFYNVDRAVGPGCPNQHDDVLLVQYLLKWLYAKRQDLHYRTLQPPSEPMKVDGIAGPITFRWIRRYQEGCKAFGASKVVDGKVDRASGFGYGPRTGTQYTIINLNSEYGVVCPAYYSNLAAAPDCPPHLAAAVSL